jgi:hypothetical protein
LDANFVSPRIWALPSRSALDTVRQKSLSRATRALGAFPAMMAPLIAPIDVPATQSGTKPFSSSAW